MPTREEIIIEARSWLGTPFRHQGMIKGLSVDCAGFIEGVAVASGATPPVEIAHDYRRREDGTVMLRLLNEYMVEVEHPEDAQIGDVIAFHDGGQPDAPRHLAILSQIRDDGVRYIIHASARGVAEHRMDAAWSSKIHSVWKIKNLG